VASALLVLAGAAVLCAVFGIVAAIAIPNFIRFGARSKQAECKATLTRLSTAQQRHRAAKGAFATTFEALAFSASPGNRYAYVLGRGEGQRLEPSPRMGPPGLSTADLERASAAADAYTALCIANIDNDEGVDVWGVSSTTQRDATGAEVAAGTPFVLVDDVPVFP
jgi:type IV pilus assembly protein PilA